MSEARNGLTSAQDGLSAASTAAEKTLAAADASYDAVARAADEAFATMKDDPAAAQGVLAACRSDVQGLAQAYQTMRDALAGADPSSPAIGALDRIIAQLDTLEANLDTAENAIGADAASIDEKHAKVTDSINQARAALRDSMSTYNDQLKGELASLADSLQKVGTDTQTLAGSLKDTAESLGDSTDSLAANLATAEASLRKTAETLRTAESQLAQARDDLRHALDTGDIDEVCRIIGDNPAAIAQFLAAPTHLERHAVYPMADNGSAMSPFYTSLALWIGAIFMVALMSVSVSPARQAALTRKFGRAPRAAELCLGRYGVFCLLGLAQALIVGLGNVFFLGVECEHFWLYLAACCGVHEPGIHADGVFRQHREGARHHRSRAAAGRRRRPHAGSNAVGPAVPGDLPVAALRPFHAGAGRGHGRHLRRPVPRADGPARGHPGAEPHSRPRPAAPRHPAEPVGARQAGRDEVPLAPRRVQAPVDGLKLAKLDETSLAALSSNGQKIRADCFSEGSFSPFAFLRARTFATTGF